MFSVRDEMIDFNQEDNLALYEATGYSRLDEVYRLNSKEYNPDGDDDDDDEDTSMSSHSSSTGSPYGTTTNSDSESTDCSETQMLLKDESSSEYSEADNEEDNENDDESEDEITHDPLSAKEVLEHNKLFGRKTRDFWWVHNGKVYSDDFVAYLRPMSRDEIVESTKEEIVELKKELANSGTLSDTMDDFDKILSRYQVVLNRQPSIHNGDPNIVPFPTPFDFIPTDMRKWISTWEPFDFELQPWPCIETEPVPPQDTHAILIKSLRPWLDKWKPFDMEIEGECAWTCIEPSLFEKDIVTEDQLKTLESRKNRSDMNDLDRMAKRRRTLANYFKKKYRKSDEDMNIYSTFAQNLEQNSIELLSLC